mgnify:CR=1 FL=1
MSKRFVVLKFVYYRLQMYVAHYSHCIVFNALSIIGSGLETAVLLCIKRDVLLTSIEPMVVLSTFVGICHMILLLSSAYAFPNLPHHRLSQHRSTTNLHSVTTKNRADELQKLANGLGVSPTKVNELLLGQRQKLTTGTEKATYIDWLLDNTDVNYNKQLSNNNNKTFKK